jgi:hypothetical protein
VCNSRNAGAPSWSSSTRFVPSTLCPVKRGQLHPDYGVYCGQWSIGRIYETRTGPADLRWFWALHASGGGETLRSSIHAATLEIAKTEFEASWKLWKAWAGMEETSG